MEKFSLTIYIHTTQFVFYHRNAKIKLHFYHHNILYSSETNKKFTKHFKK